MPNRRTYDLEERTAKFGERVIAFCRKLKPDVVIRPLISQLVRSSTSIGANYREANGASSKKDFRNKIFISKKEAKETEHWLRMIAASLSTPSTELAALQQESLELVLIFQKIGSTVSSK